MGYWVVDEVFLDLFSVVVPMSSLVNVWTLEEVVGYFLMASAQWAELLFRSAVYVMAGL